MKTNLVIIISHSLLNGNESNRESKYKIWQIPDSTMVATCISTIKRKNTRQIKSGKNGTTDLRICGACSTMYHSGTHL